MGFFKNIFSKKKTLLKSEEEPIPEDYPQNSLLRHCRANRNLYIGRMCRLELEEIDQMIEEYEENLIVYKDLQSDLICRFIEEKLYQLRTAKDIIGKK